MIKHIQYLKVIRYFTVLIVFITTLFAIQCLIHSKEKVPIPTSYVSPSIFMIVRYEHTSAKLK